MDAALKLKLTALIADAQRRKPTIGDLKRDTLVAVYGDLLNSAPNYGYINRIVELALAQD